MQQTRMHKAVTRRIEAKKLLSRRRQSEYSGVIFEYKNAFLVGFIYIRDPSQTFVEWGADAKRGPLRSFDSPKGPWKKWIFLGKLSLWFSMVLTHNFHVKKWGPEIFEVWKEGPPKIFPMKFFASGPPTQQVFVNGP